MNTSAISRELLGALWQEAFVRLQQQLGEGFEKLKCSRVPERHGTCTSVLISRIYDRRQSDATIPWRFCCYALNYDPVDFETTGHNWCLKLHFNTVRLYFGLRDEVAALIRREFPRICPPGFVCIVHQRQAVIERQFTCHGSEADAVRLAAIRLPDLLRATYPVFKQALAMAESSVPGPAEAGRDREGRDKVHAPAANKYSVDRRRAMNRGIPPALRGLVMKRDRGICQICLQPCERNDIHIDHIKPVAQGGLTTLQNLQTTCRRCNLTKGSGRSRPPESHIPAKVRPRP